jgi:predicted dinucleotide-binding enzyme
MRIGIIGAGFIGRAVARLGVMHGHEVMASNSRGPETLASMVSGIGCRIGTVEEATAFGEVVVLAIPLNSYRSVPVAPLVGKVVLDANNYYPERDGRIADLDARKTTTSEMLARHLPRSHHQGVQCHPCKRLREGRPSRRITGQKGLASRRR